MAGIEATLHYDDGLMLRATLFYWRRKLGRDYLGWTVGLLAAVVMLALLGVGGWFIAVLATLVGVSALLPIVGLYYARRAARDSMRKLDPPRAEVALAEDGFTMTTSMGTSNLKWSAINEVWRAPEFTLVFFSQDTFAVLPAAGAPARVLETFAERVRAAGGKVR
jgi:hypothetical protein